VLKTAGRGGGKDETTPEGKNLKCTACKRNLEDLSFQKRNTGSICTGEVKAERPLSKVAITGSPRPPSRKKEKKKTNTRPLARQKKGGEGPTPGLCHGGNRYGGCARKLQLGPKKKAVEGPSSRRKQVKQEALQTTKQKQEEKRLKSVNQRGRETRAHDAFKHFYWGGHTGGRPQKREAESTTGIEGRGKISPTSEGQGEKNWGRSERGCRGATRIQKKVLF